MLNGLIIFGHKEDNRQWVISKAENGKCQASYKQWPDNTLHWIGTDFDNMEEAIKACKKHRKNRLQ